MLRSFVRSLALMARQGIIACTQLDKNLVDFGHMGNYQNGMRATSHMCEYFNFEFWRILRFFSFWFENCISHQQPVDVVGVVENISNQFVVVVSHMNVLLLACSRKWKCRMCSQADWLAFWSSARVTRQDRGGSVVIHPQWKCNFLLRNQTCLFIKAKQQKIA